MNCQLVLNNWVVIKHFSADYLGRVKYPIFFYHEVQSLRPAFQWLTAVRLEGLAFP